MADRTINVAGSFKQPVDITNSLQNGYGCISNNYSHAEGFETSATGEYSYAGGYHANAVDKNSYVWSGIDDKNRVFTSKTAGSYNIFVQGNNALENFYINEESIKNRITETFSPSFSNELLKSSTNIWTGFNTFNGNVTLGNGSNIIGTSGSELNFPQGTTANFGGTANVETINVGSENKDNNGHVNDRRIANLTYVNNLFQSSISTISTNYVKRGGSTGSIGSSVKPVYINADGNAVAITNNVVTRGDNTKEGDTTRFVYMNGGSITPSTGTVGNDGKTIVYLNNGTLTASNVNVGTANEGKTITYLKSGKITQSTATVGSSLVPIYLSNGVLTQIPNNVTIGGEHLPIYIKGGSLTACTRYIPSGGSGDSIKSFRATDQDGSYGGQTGLIGSNGNNFIKQLISYTDSNYRTVLYGITSRPTIANIDGLETKHTNFTNSLAVLNSSCTGFKSSCANLVSSLAKYAPKFGVKVTGTGNVISSVAFENSSASINLQKNLTALTAANTSGTGNVLTNLSYSGATATATKGYAVTSVTGQRSSGTTNQFVNALSYSNGTLNVGWGTAQSSGGASNLLLSVQSNTNTGKKPSVTVTTDKDGITFIYLRTTYENGHNVTLSYPGYSSTIPVSDGGLLSIANLSRGSTITVTANKSVDSAQTFILQAGTLYLQ